MNYNPHDPDYFAKMLRDAIAGIVENTVRKVIDEELTGKEHFFAMSRQMLNECEVRSMLNGNLPDKIYARVYRNGPMYFRIEDVEHYMAGGTFDEDGNILPL
jgi:hypothetical protein